MRYWSRFISGFPSALQALHCLPHEELLAADLNAGDVAPMFAAKHDSVCRLAAGNAVDADDGLEEAKFH
jgi:hypothetical protein